jgi:hypothetical protein
VSREGPPRLVALEGGLRDHVKIGAATVVPAPADRPPFAIGARIEEEDRYLVLSAKPTFTDPGPLHPIRLHTELVTLEPKALGTVVLQRGVPHRLLAVVHDLDQEPSSQREWVREALHAALRCAKELQIHALALPLLGAVHRGISQRESLDEIKTALLEAELERVWLIVAAGAEAEAIERLGGIPG